MDFHPIVQNRFKRAALSYKFVVKHHFCDVIIKTSDLEETNLAKKIMKMLLRYEKISFTWTSNGKLSKVIGHIHVILLATA